MLTAQLALVTRCRCGLGFSCSFRIQSWFIMGHMGRLAFDVVSWEPEGRYCRSKMFRWEPEGRYCHWLCTAIAPFWFSTEHLWAAITPFWLSTDDVVYIVSWEPEGHYENSVMFLWEPEGRYRCTEPLTVAPFWFSADDKLNVCLHTVG